MRRPARPYRALPAAAAAVAGVAACASVPRVDAAAEEQAIRNLAPRWGQAIAFFVVPNGPAARGEAAIRQMFGQLLRAPNLSLQLTPLRIEVARLGDLAYDFGTYRMAFDGPQGRVEDEGHYTVVWRKVNGQWRAAVDINTSAKPLPSR